MSGGEDRADLEAQVTALKCQLEELWNYVFALHLAMVAPGDEEREREWTPPVPFGMLGDFRRFAKKPDGGSSPNG